MYYLMVALIALLALAGCDHTGRISEPAPSPTATPAEPTTGGTCGDGRILKPGEQCP
jgi:hypothetical protein